MPSEKPVKKQETKEVIPEEITRILSERANQLDRHMESLKRETQACNRLTNELSEGVNESNRSKRLHDKAMKEMEEEIGKDKITFVTIHFSPSKFVYPQSYSR